MSHDANIAPVGTALPPREFGPITTQMLVRYSGVSGDLNPMHYDHSFATSAGYPGVFSQGMHHAALMASFIADFAGAENVRGFLAKFLDQVWIGDVLSCTGEVTELEDTGEGLAATIAVRMATQDGRAVLSGEATVIVNPELWSAVGSKQ